jgi:Leucine-rich repeat (LRR) protein
LPPLPNLRFLAIHSPEHRATGLENLTSLRELDLQHSEMSIETLHELAKLPHLRKLSLSAYYFQAECVPVL